jgi:hypothetical protein
MLTVTIVDQMEALNLKNLEEYLIHIESKTIPGNLRQEDEGFSGNYLIVSDT